MQNQGTEHKIIKCHTCGNLFEPKTYRNIFCSRGCFMKFYRMEEKKEEYPSYICPNCRKMTRLNFDPKKSVREWMEFKCPFCNVAQRQESRITEYYHQEETTVTLRRF